VVSGWYRFTGVDITPLHFGRTYDPTIRLADSVIRPGRWRKLNLEELYLLRDVIGGRKADGDDDRAFVQVGNSVMKLSGNSVALGSLRGACA
jgi:hypothetical protein